MIPNLKRIKLASRFMLNRFPCLSYIIRSRLSPKETLKNSSRASAIGHKQTFELIKLLLVIAPVSGFKMVLTNYCRAFNAQVILGIT